MSRKKRKIEIVLGRIETDNNLSATVLDTAEDLNNLYRTISRKRILNKVGLD